MLKIFSNPGVFEFYNINSKLMPLKNNMENKATEKKKYLFNSFLQNSLLMNQKISGNYDNPSFLKNHSKSNFNKNVSKNKEPLYLSNKMKATNQVGNKTIHSDISKKDQAIQMSKNLLKQNSEKKRISIKKGGIKHEENSDPFLISNLIPICNTEENEQYTRKKQMNIIKLIKPKINVMKLNPQIKNNKMEPFLDEFALIKEYTKHISDIKYEESLKSLKTQNTPKNLKLNSSGRIQKQENIPFHSLGEGCIKHSNNSSSRKLKIKRKISFSKFTDILSNPLIKDNITKRHVTERKKCFSERSTIIAITENDNFPDTPIVNRKTVFSNVNFHSVL
jgi:hypothetical protein